MEGAGWSASVDAYCERLDASFWSEPLNAASNAAFVAAAVAAALLLRRQPRHDPAAALLVAIVAAIGLGSFLFHTVATRWAALADVVPIAVFIHVYLFVAARRFLGLGAWAALAVVVVFVAISRLGELGLRTALAGSNAALVGSIGYVPAAAALFVMGGLALSRGDVRSRPDLARAGRALLGLGLLFSVSLSVRSADLALCEALPSGTHWLWHLLNATVLYGLMRTAVLLGPPGRDEVAEGPLPDRHGRGLSRGLP